MAYPDFQLLDFGGGEGDFEVSEEEINIGISLKKGNTALKDAINEVLSTMTTDDYNAMMDHRGPAPEPGLTPCGGSPVLPLSVSRPPWAGPVLPSCCIRPGRSVSTDVPKEYP